MRGADRRGGSPWAPGRNSQRGRRSQARARRRRIAVLFALASVAAVLGVAWASGGSSDSPRSITAGTGRSATAHDPAAGTRSAAGTPTAAGGAGARRGASAESPEIRRLIALGRPIYCAAPRGNEVALTFDDGPGPYTRLVLAKLRKHHVGATFFVVGRNIPLVQGKGGVSVTRQERAVGMVGDHTFTHPLLTALAPGQAEAEIARTQTALARASGGGVFLFRPPYGAHDAKVDRIARAHGLLEILWTVDSADSLGAGFAQIERNVIAGLRPGAIILMHENHGQTVRALINIFAALTRRHLHAVSVAQLLTEHPPSAAQVRAGGHGCGLSANVSLSGH